MTKPHTPPPATLKRPSTTHSIPLKHFSQPSSKIMTTFNSQARYSNQPQTDLTTLLAKRRIAHPSSESTPSLWINIRYARHPRGIHTQTAPHPHVHPGHRPLTGGAHSNHSVLPQHPRTHVPPPIFGPRYTITCTSHHHTEIHHIERSHRPQSGKDILDHCARTQRGHP